MFHKWPAGCTASKPWALAYNAQSLLPYMVCVTWHHWLHILSYYTWERLPITIKQWMVNLSKRKAPWLLIEAGHWRANQWWCHIECKYLPVLYACQSSLPMGCRHWLPVPLGENIACIYTGPFVELFLIRNSCMSRCRGTGGTSHPGTVAFGGQLLLLTHWSAQTGRDL